MTTPEPEPPADGIDEATINRNWTELIQELRSTQTGVQVLTGFLLTVPFSSRFASLDDVQRTAYLIVLTLLGRGDGGDPVAGRLPPDPVPAGAATVAGPDREPGRPGRAGAGGADHLRGVFLVFDLAIGRAAGVTASLIALVAYLVLWVGVPLRARTCDPRNDSRTSRSALSTFRSTRQTLCQVPRASRPSSTGHGRVRRHQGRHHVRAAVARAAVPVLPAVVGGQQVARAASRSSSLPAPVSMIAMPAVACGTKTCSRPSPRPDAKSAQSRGDVEDLLGAAGAVAAGLGVHGADGVRSPPGPGPGLPGRRRPGPPRR